MSDKDQIKELFSQKLGSYEAKVNPELWANISSQIGTTAAASSAAGGMSLFTKAIIGISAASVITTGAILYYNSDDATPEKEQQKTEIQSDSESKIEKEKTIKVVQPVADSGSEPTSDVEPVIVPVNPKDDSSVPSTTGPNDGKASPEYYMQHKEEMDAKMKRELQAKEEQLRKEQERKAAEEEAKKNEMLVSGSEEQLHLKDAPQPDKNEETSTPNKIQLELPNGFTPNGDGSNDELYMDIPENVAFFEITILNAKGELVYSSQDPNFKWGGQDMRSNEMVPKGKYVYFVIVKTADGQELKEGQTLTIY